MNDLFCLPSTPEQDAAWLDRMKQIANEFRELIQVDHIAEMLERAYLKLQYFDYDKVTYKKLIYNALVIAGYSNVQVSWYLKTFDYRMPLGSNMHDAAYDKIKQFVDRYGE